MIQGTISGLGSRPVRPLGVGKVVFGGLPKAANSRDKPEQPGQTGAANAEMYNSIDTSKKTKIRLKIR
jgi:hypothetical protein